MKQLEINYKESHEIIKLPINTLHMILILYI